VFRLPELRRRLRGIATVATSVLLVALADEAVLAVPHESEKDRARPMSALEQAREESGLDDRPRSRYELPAGALRLSAPELLASHGDTLEFSVKLDRAVRDGALDLTLPARWVTRSGVSGLAHARVPERGRGSGPRGDARRSGRTVELAFDDARAGDSASFSLSEIGIPAGRYRLPYRWREGGEVAAGGTVEVVFYAQTREAAEGVPAWARLPVGGIEVNASDDADTESETFITAVPGDRQRFIVGANGGGGFGAWITDDGGQTFARATMPTATDAPSEAGPEVSNFCCDPMSAADAGGNLWYGGLSQSNGAGNPSRIVVSRAAPGASAFQPQTVGLPRRGGSGTQDKPMMTIDNSPASPTFGRLYVVWDEPSGAGINLVISQCDTRPAGNANPANCDNADNWSAPVSVTPSTGSYIYADVAVGPAGQVYVVWWDYSSVNAIRGDVCLPASQNCANAAGWGTPQTIATLDATGGSPLPFACPIIAQPGGRASTSPQVDVDRSGGAHHGRVYVSWSDLRTGSGTTKCGSTPSSTHLTFDAFVASAAGDLPGGPGPSPSVATRLLSDGDGGGQANSDDWFPWLAVDQTTGLAWADFYSTRDDPSRKTTHFYVRSVTPSDDGHAVGALTRVSGAASDYSGSPCCDFGNDYGDYTGIDATEGVALPVWSDKRAGQDGEAFTFVEPRPSLRATTHVIDDSAQAGGDGDGALEPGESFRLTQSLQNAGRGAATSLSASLEESAPAFVADPGSSAYPDIDPGATQANSTPFSGTLQNAASCGTPVPARIRVGGAEGSFAVPVSLTTGAAGPPRASTTSPGAAIPDNNATGVSTSLGVSGVGVLRDINVRLNVEHTWDSDLTVVLRDPSGATVTLIARRGGDGDNFTNTVLDDAAATAIGAGSAPFTGSFRPEQSLTAFSGHDADGTWTLTVTDAVKEDTGTVVSWGLDLRGAVCSELLDTDPPQSTITDGPADGATVTTATPQFSFVADEDGSTFECRTDSSAFVPCTSPFSTPPLGNGTHSFEVRGTDRVGNAEPTASRRTFTVAVSPGGTTTTGPTTTTDPTTTGTTDPGEPPAPTTVPTSTATTPATPAAIDPGVPPLARLVFGSGTPGRVRVTRKGTATLRRPTLRCPAGAVACRITARATARLPRSSRSTTPLARTRSRIASASATLAGGRTARVRLRLTRKARSALRRVRTMRARVTIVGTRGTLTARKTVTVTLLAPR